jgi:outer membrane protein assembly factor BamD
LDLDGAAVPQQHGAAMARTGVPGSDSGPAVGCDTLCFAAAAPKAPILVDRAPMPQSRTPTTEPTRTGALPAKAPQASPARRWLQGLLIMGTAALVGLAGCASDPKDNDRNKTAQKLYDEAREEAAAGAYDRASKLYERLEGVAAGTLLAQQAQLERAYLLYRQQEKAQALSAVERFLKLHPTSPAADYAYYLQGVINFNDDLGLFGKWVDTDLSERDQQASRDAYQSFKQLVDRFPDSRYTPDARQRMIYIVNTLASYEVHVARYYFKRGAYVAALNRAQQAVVDYRDVAPVEEALAIMATSYERLGMDGLRDDTRRVLARNYPQSAWLKSPYGGAEKSLWRWF